MTIPFTPYHFGPGFLVKACAPERFWLTSFIAANVLIDLEVLYYLERRETPIHRYFHTYVGGVAIGLVAAVGVGAAVTIAKRYMPAELPSMQRFRSTPTPRLFGETIVAGLLGGITHVFLDSLMHHDMHPFWPFADGNALAGTIGVGALHLALAGAGLFGIILWMLLPETR